MAKIEIRARYSETDQMGIIHHSHYISWFEEARTHFFRSLCISYSDIEKEGLLLPVIRSEVFYRTPARFEELLIVHCNLEHYNGVRLTFKYKVEHAEKGSIVAEGYTEHCWTNKELRPTKINREWPHLHETLKGHMEGNHSV